MSFYTIEPFQWLTTYEQFLPFERNQYFLLSYYFYYYYTIFRLRFLKPWMQLFLPNGTNGCLMWLFVGKAQLAKASWFEISGSIWYTVSGWYGQFHPKLLDYLFLTQQLLRLFSSPYMFFLMFPPSSTTHGLLPRKHLLGAVKAIH